MATYDSNSYLTFSRGGVSISSGTYGVVCLEGMLPESYEAKEPFTEDWKDQNGLDCYDSGVVRLKDSDISIPMGADSVSGYRSFIGALVKNGELWTVTSAHTGMSVSGARFVKADPDGFDVYINESGTEVRLLTFKLTLKIMSPSL